MTLVRKYFQSFLFLPLFFFLQMGIACIGFFSGAFICMSDQTHLIEGLENYRPALITHIYDHTGKTRIANLFEEYRQSRSLEFIPQNMINAILAAEDDNFFHHMGIKPLRIAYALYKNFTAGRIRLGASTITQQLAKNLLAGHERSYARKLNEMFISFQLERHYSKNQILEMYLNYIFLGDRTHNAHGVQAASKAYFGKDIEDLSLSECAILAGMPKAPNLYSPARNPKAALRRRDWILMRMYISNKISYQQYSVALDDPIQLHDYKASPTIAPYFIDYIKQDLLKNPKVRYDGLFHRGLSIYTTLDTEIQKLTEKAFQSNIPKIEALWQENRNRAGIRSWKKDIPLEKGKEHLVKIEEIRGQELDISWKEYRGTLLLPELLPYHRSEQIIKKNYFIMADILDLDAKKQTFEARLADTNYLQGAAVVIDTKTGDIRGLCGGYDYNDNDNMGKWNRVTQAYRQIGSCIKPLFFATALEDLNRTAASIIEDDRLVFYFAGKKWEPQNYETKYYGPTIYQEALEHSRNVPAIKLLNEMGLTRGIRWLKRFGITSNKRRKIPANLTLALGSMEVNPLEIAEAYLPFVRKGIRIKPRAYTRIEKGSGETILKNIPQEKIILSDENAYIMTNMLQGVIKRGTAYGGIGEKWPKNYPEIAGKTGTTDNCTEAWFVGYSPDYLVAVYVAFDRKISLGRKMSGGKIAGPIWYEIMDQLVKQKKSTTKKFPIPENIEFHDICTESGELASKGCYKAWRALVSDQNFSDDLDFYVIKNVAFKKGTAPEDSCHLHQDWN